MQVFLKTDIVISLNVSVFILRNCNRWSVENKLFGIEEFLGKLSDCIFPHFSEFFLIDF